jgi:hypothetical protein
MLLIVNILMALYFEFVYVQHSIVVRVLTVSVTLPILHYSAGSKKTKGG